MHPDWIGNVKIESPDKLIDAYSNQLERAKSAIAQWLLLETDLTLW